jgi:hypothetical protein
MGSCTITDRADGTGISVAVSGLSGTGTLWVSGFASNLASQAFTSARTFNANGTYTVSLTNGPYFAVYTDAAGINAPISFRVTNGDTGLHERCLQAIREFVIASALPGVPTDPTKHKTHKRPIRTIAEFGKPLTGGLHYWKEQEQRSQGDNVRDRVVYPITMAYLASNDGDNRSDPDWTLLREIIGRSFPRCPLSDIDEVHTVRVVPGVLYGSVDSAANIDVQLMRFDCITEEISLFE